MAGLVGIDNVFDTDYEDIVGYAGQERRALLQLTTACK